MKSDAVVFAQLQELLTSWCHPLRAQLPQHIDRAVGHSSSQTPYHALYETHVVATDFLRGPAGAALNACSKASRTSGCRSGPKSGQSGRAQAPPHIVFELYWPPTFADDRDALPDEVQSSQGSYRARTFPGDSPNRRDLAAYPNPAQQRLHMAATRYVTFVTEAHNFKAAHSTMRTLEPLYKLRIC